MRFSIFIDSASVIYKGLTLNGSKSLVTLILQVGNLASPWAFPESMMYLTAEDSMQTRIPLSYDVSLNI
jgi:hypothetical protein